MAVERSPFYVEQSDISEFAKFGGELKEFADTFFPYGIAENTELIEGRASLLEPKYVQKRLDRDGKSPFAGLVYSPVDAFPQADAFGGGVQSTTVRLQITGEEWSSMAHIDAGWKRKVGIHFEYLSEKGEDDRTHKAIQRLSIIADSRTLSEPPMLRRMITRENEGDLIIDNEMVCPSIEEARHFLGLAEKMGERKLL